MGTRKTLQFVETKRKYCEPTSSKIKVEDLTTTEQELAQPEKHQITQASSNNLGTQQFWDRPIPKPQYDWPYDPCMPNERNEVIASMQSHDIRDMYRGLGGKGY